jgi:pyruvate dehydrogenase E2 component (dihydrolipoamide acetyltransferase)
MPSLGADMEAGTLLAWRVKPGDAVRRGDIVALVDTDKAEIEVEIFADGVIEELLVEPGRKVPVGTALARLREAGAAAAAKPAPAPAVAPVAPVRAPEPRRAVELPRPVAPALAAPLRASPLARRVAAELEVDLAAVQGTGERGAITREDVERASAQREPGAPEAAAPVPPLARAPAEAPEERAAPERTAGMRRAIAAAMARSKREIPHYYLATQIDLSRALRWLEADNAQRGVTERVLPAALLLRAVALALREVPELNGHFIDGVLRPSEAVHLGVAIALRQGGLVAPALHDADRKPLGELMAVLRDLVQRTRAGVLRSSELTDATSTVTNLGDLGVETVFGVIYPPQVALVGIGRVRERPWAEDGLLGVRPLVNVTLAADHRASDGHRGGRFLTALERLLQQPEAL